MQALALRNNGTYANMTLAVLNAFELRAEVLVVSALNTRSSAATMASKPDLSRNLE